MDQFEITLRVPKSPRFRFGLKVLFTIALVVAVGFGAYQLGNRDGFDRGFPSGYRTGWSEAMSAKLYTESYRATDLVRSLDGTKEGGKRVMIELNAIIDEIAAEVDPASWHRNSGPATILIYPQTLGIVVKQTAEGHDKVKAFLERKRLEMGIEP